MIIGPWLRLARREEAWKTAEILLLRHPLAVLQRQQPRRPKLNWADRAFLATLLSVIVDEVFGTHNLSLVAGRAVVVMRYGRGDAGVAGGP
jgi:hypothetical protein